MGNLRFRTVQMPRRDEGSRFDCADAIGTPRPADPRTTNQSEKRDGFMEQFYGVALRLNAISRLVFAASRSGFSSSALS